jgi:hypothetical protein
MTTAALLGATWTGPHSSASWPTSKPAINCVVSYKLVIHKLGPYLLGVTGLRVDGKALEITLGMGNWSAVLSFDLGKSDLLGAGPAPPEGSDPVKAWLARLGDVNKPDESGATAAPRGGRPRRFSIRQGFTCSRG